MSMRALPIELRQRIVDAYLRGEGSLRDMADRFDVGINSVVRLVDRYRREETVEPRPHGGGFPSKLDDAALGRLRAFLETHPTATLQEMADHIAETEGVRLSIQRYSQLLQRMRYSRKKGRCTRPSATRRV